jgi:hypothetical protein
MIYTTAQEQVRAELVTLMNMGRSVAQRGQIVNYIEQQTCHYKRSSKSAKGASQVVDPPRLPCATAAKTGFETSNLGGQDR